MVDGTNVIFVEESLPPGMSTQKVERVALTKTLELGTSKKINSHMDNRYTFASAHAHRHICQEDCSYQRKPTGNLGPLRCPNEASNCIIHCPGHQKGKDSMDNNQAEQVAPGMDMQEPILIMGL